MKHKLFKPNTVIFIPSGYREQLFVVTRREYNKTIQLHEYDIKSLKNYYDDIHFGFVHNNVQLNNAVTVCSTSSIMEPIGDTTKRAMSMRLFYQLHPEYQL